MFVVVLILLLMAFPASADANCQTHKCWHRVHIVRVEHMIQRRIDAIAIYRCGPVQSVKPCWVINQESSTAGYWTALNTWTYGIPCLQRACGIYQFLGWNVPWPVIVVGNKLKTLHNELAHHRQAMRLPLSAWGG